jgi:hypothetical protein
MTHTHSIYLVILPGIFVLAKPETRNCSEFDSRRVTGLKSVAGEFDLQSSFSSLWGTKTAFSASLRSVTSIVFPNLNGFVALIQFSRGIPRISFSDFATRSSQSLRDGCLTDDIAFQSQRLPPEKSTWEIHAGNPRGKQDLEGNDSIPRIPQQTIKVV